MNSQPRDILYLIIAYLEYTPDTARLGRVCKYLDSIPCWYERSGHLQPHNEYRNEYKGINRYMDGQVKERFSSSLTGETQSLWRHPVTHFLSAQGRLVQQNSIWKGEQTTIGIKSSGLIYYLRTGSLDQEITAELDNSRTVVHVSISFLRSMKKLVFDLGTKQILSLNDQRSDETSWYEHRENNTTLVSHSNHTTTSMSTDSLPTLFDFDMGIFQG
jgi:hypothetical protein